MIVSAETLSPRRDRHRVSGQIRDRGRNVVEVRPEQPRQAHQRNMKVVVRLWRIGADHRYADEG
jgi:hypothetical protein